MCFRRSSFKRTNTNCRADGTAPWRHASKAKRSRSNAKSARTLKTPPQRSICSMHRAPLGNSRGTTCATSTSEKGAPRFTTCTIASSGGQLATSLGAPQSSQSEAQRSTLRSVSAAPARQRNEEVSASSHVDTLDNPSAPDATTLAMRHAKDAQSNRAETRAMPAPIM